MIADKVGKSRSGYATARIDIHTDQILISAESVVIGSALICPAGIPDVAGCGR